MNYVELVGIVINTKGLCEAEMEVERLSGVKDRVIVKYPEYMSHFFSKGLVTRVNGYFKTKKNGKHREYYVYCMNADFTDEPDRNFVLIDGNIAKKPIYRYTPLGREITDVILKNENDYIPLVYWGEHARFMSSKEIGDYVKIKGRIQSREYIKHYIDGSEQVKTAYEISVDEIEE